MAKTPQQRVVLCVQHAERSSRGLEAARASGNCELIALNIQQGFDACLKQGLINWRFRLESPVPSLSEAVKRIDAGLAILDSLGIAKKLKDVTAERAWIVNYLLNRSFRIIDDETLRADRLLDAVLAGGLLGDWNQTAWDTGMEQLEMLEGTALAVETYSTYCRMLNGPDEDVASLADSASKLFELRAKDAFFDGGDATEGGGLYNSITVDYRFAAIIKKLGLEIDCIHRF